MMQLNQARGKRWYLLKDFLFACYLSFSFALMQKKQKIKENPTAPRVFPCLRSAKAFN